MRVTEDQVFYKGGSAALLVMSPFQLLCAREAVEEFQFDEYKYVFILSSRTSKRNEQMFQMANDWGIKFDLYDASSINISDFLVNKGIFDKGTRINKYDRIFSGDYWSPECRMLAKKYARENAIVTFVDDGTASIYVLSGHFCCGMQSGSWTDMIKWYHLKYSTHRNLRTIDKELERWDIYVTKSIFSAYSDVTPTSFLTRQNTFQRLLSDSTQTSCDEETVYFIGSPSDDLCLMYGIDLDYLNEILFKQLCDVRNHFLGKNFIYIPHPRDTNQEILNYCNELSIEYNSLNQPAEDFIRNHNKNVLAIYGFGSSTLINMKRMFPQMKVFDIVIENPRKKQYNRRVEIINTYYRQNGIEMIKMIIPDEKNRIHRISLRQNLIDLFFYLVHALQL